jgi:hypothetical protein
MIFSTFYSSSRVYALFSCLFTSQIIKMKNSSSFIFLSKCAFGLSLVLLIASLYVLTNKREETKQAVRASSTTATTEAPNEVLVAPPVAPTQQEKTRTLTPLPFVAQKMSKETPQYFGTFEVENEEKEENDASTVGERLQFEFDMLKDPKTGKIPKGVSEKSLIAAAQAPTFESQWSSGGSSAALDIPGMTIEARGPNNLGGRTRAIGIDKRDANMMLAGSVSSGIFRTTNGGTSWTRVVPIGQIHNVTAIAQDTRAGQENTWYFGGGEGSGNSTSLGSSYRGFGIWKSTDNGVTWAQLASTISGTTLEAFDNPFDYVHRLVVDPTNSNVYAAAGTSIMRSPDGGATVARRGQR